jgi:coproporphyrinogen III oxidase
MRGRFERMIRGVQAKVVAAVQEVDGKEFRQDAWTRPAGGGGITRVLQEGNVWEKAGVAVSVVYGSMPAEAYRVAVGKDIPYGKVRGLGWAGLGCAAGQLRAGRGGAGQAGSWEWWPESVCLL